MIDKHDVQVPITEFTRQVAVEAARTVTHECLENCTRERLDVVDRIEKMDIRLRNLEKRFATLIGAVIGSGALGGSITAVMMKLLGV